jgi:hypothetical protein
MREYQVVRELESIFDEVVSRTEVLLKHIQHSQGDAWALSEPTPDHRWLSKLRVNPRPMRAGS